MRDGTIGARRKYLSIYAALVTLTAVTVLVSYVDLGMMNVVAALLIASAKASLVGLFFMHLKGESRLVWGFALVPIHFLFLILSGTLVDTLLR
jgi:cytochrome c oxidase subunit 4